MMRRNKKVYLITETKPNGSQIQKVCGSSRRVSYHFGRVKSDDGDCVIRPHKLHKGEVFRGEKLDGTRILIEPMVIC